MPKKQEPGIGGTRITLTHIEQGAKWAIKARKAEKAIRIDGVKRKFDLGVYDTGTDCGTACCILGAAALLAGHSGRKPCPLPEASTFSTTKAGGAAVQAHMALAADAPDLHDACCVTGRRAYDLKAPERVLRAIAAIRKAEKVRHA